LRQRDKWQLRSLQARISLERKESHLLAATLTAAGMHYALNWDWGSAVVFGVLIAATDPVSVIATFKEARVHGRLRLLIEAESLLNDGSESVGIECEIQFKNVDPALSEKTKGRRLDVLLNERTHGRCPDAPCCGDAIHLV
jgi:hypothetical protein